MKKIYNQASLIVAALFIFTTNSFAAIITCNNNVLAVGQYSTIQAAVSASHFGDTVYVAPSPYNYGDVTITKKITLMGGGFNNSGTQFGWDSGVNVIRLDSTYGTTISGVRIIGLYVGSYISNDSYYPPVHYSVIERCYLNSTINVLGTGWIIKNNIVNYTYINLNNNANTIISNNIFTNCYSTINNSNNPSTLVTNNIFLYSSGSNNQFSNTSYATVSNNIFFYTNNDSNGGCTYCTYNNNITYNSAGPLAVIPGTNNTGGNNFNGQDPKFVSAPYHNSSFNTNEISFSDWHLAAGSPGKNAGTDGKDVGVYGGVYPPTNWQGVPAIPQMQIVNINNAVIPQGGTLNVTFKARKRN